MRIAVPCWRAHFQKRGERLVDAVKLGGIFGIGVFELAEGASRVNEIARIYAHFIRHFSGCKSCARIEMNIGRQAVHCILADEDRNVSHRYFQPRGLPVQ